MERGLRAWVAVLAVVILVWLVLYLGVTFGGWRLLP